MRRLVEVIMTSACCLAAVAPTQYANAVNTPQESAAAVQSESRAEGRAAARTAATPKKGGPTAVRARRGDELRLPGDMTVVVADRRLGFGSGDTYDPDIASPKSATFSHDGKKIYVNSLEGCRTVVYDAATRRKIKTIRHSFPSGTGDRWLPASGLYPFTHYADGERRAFRGKPVEEALTPDGRYLFVPYYRRDFDLNAQDPSALAVIDTRVDSIVLMVETGPLPKMVRVSNDGRLLAITHWGDNTVGLLDISDPDPRRWRHRPPVTVGAKLKLNYSLTTPVNRDSGSGLLLRGTVFLPGDSLLLVSAMAGQAAVIDVRRGKWLGSIPSLANVRHITLQGDMLYLSRNSAGEVLTVPVDSVVAAVERGRASRRFLPGGIRSARVGGGARTLKVSPSGRYIFVACNAASALYIVRAADMKVLGRITADSFPVGLDISPDGSTVVTTSQGRAGAGGGNAVDFFTITYDSPETPAKAPEPAETPAAGTGRETPDTGQSDPRRETGSLWRRPLTYVIMGGAAAAAAAVVIYRRNRS